MKRILYRLIICTMILSISCKNNKKTNKEDVTETENSKINKSSYLDKELEDALYKGYFAKSENGYDTVLKDNILYLLKKNPTDAEKKDSFFLHILPKGAKEINMDFEATRFRYNDKLSDNFSTVWVYKRELPKIDGPYSIEVGQTDGTKRTWSTSVLVDGLNTKDYIYNNEYVAFTKNNYYLKEFETAFNEGYFMKHQEGFDLLLDNHTVYYIKSNGADSDLEDLFFLHIKYDQSEEVHNYDFNGKAHQINQLLGKKYQNFIILKRDVLDKGEITELSTGQFDKNTRSWSVQYNIEKLYDDINFIYNDQYEEDILK